MPDHRYRLPFVQPHAVENLWMRGDFIVRGHGAVQRCINVKDAAHTADTGENAVLLGKNSGRSLLIGVHAGVTGGIARSPVFEQRVLQDGGDAA